MKRRFFILAVFALILTPFAAYPQSIGGGYLGQSSTFPQVTITQSLGADLITNGGFATDTWWTKGTGWTIAAGVATKAAGTEANLEAGAMTIASGAWYKVVYTVTSFTSGAFQISVGGVNGGFRHAEGGALTYTDYILTTGTAGLIVGAKSDAVFSIDDISCKRAYLGIDASSGGTTGSGVFAYFNASNYWIQNELYVQNPSGGNSFSAPRYFATIFEGADVAVKLTSGDSMTPLNIGADTHNTSIGMDLISAGDSDVSNVVGLIGDAMPRGGSSGAFRGVTFPTANKDYVNATNIGAAGVGVVGGFVHVLNGTGATTGVYRITAVNSANSVQVHANIHASGSDITDGRVRVYGDVIGFHANSNDGTTNGLQITAYSEANKPLILGGSYPPPATGHALTATGVLFPGITEFDGLAYFDGKMLIGASATMGNTVVEIAAATQADASMSDSPHLALMSTSADAVGRGGALGLGGISDGTTKSVFAAIAGRQAVADTATGYLSLITVLSGTGGVERQRIDQYGWHTYTMADNASPTPVAPTGGYKFWGYNKSVADDGIVYLPAVTTNARGWVTVGTGAATYSEFLIGSTGTVTLIGNSADVVANADTDTKLCLGTAATQEPLQVKNRLGSEQVINIMVWYD